MSTSSPTPSDLPDPARAAPAPARISQRRLAKIAGVHHTTVSMALRGHPEISPETRDRIRRLAEELGYRPDPMLRALNAYSQTQRQPVFHGVIAWINAWTGRNAHPGIFRTGAFRHFYAHASRHAERLGYRLEEFVLGGANGLGARRLSQVLRERGIQGVILPPLPGGRGRVALNWDWFSCVTVGHSLLRPALHTLAHDNYQNMGLLLHGLKHLGLRRIGLVSPRHEQQRTDGLRTAAFVMMQRTLPTRFPVPPLIQEDHNDEEEFFRWFDEHRPDAIAVTFTKDTIRMLGRRGIRVPEDVVVAGLNLLEREDLPGIVEDDEALGCGAVENVVSQIERAERGIPRKSRHTYVAGDWWPGKPAPGRRRPEPDTRRAGDVVRLLRQN